MTVNKRLISNLSIFFAFLSLFPLLQYQNKKRNYKAVNGGRLRQGAAQQQELGDLAVRLRLTGYRFGSFTGSNTNADAGTDAGKAGFITALYVVLVPVFGLFFKRKVSLPTWIAVVLSVVALYLLCIKGDFSLAPGDLLVLVCAVCFAVHILVIDHFTAYCDGVKLSCLQFLFAGIISTICMFIFEDVDFAAILSCALPLLYVGIFSCGVGYTLQILAQKDSNPTVVTILLSLESVFAVIAGAIILKQQMTVREYIGCAIMFAAVILAQIQFPTRQKAE